MVETMTMLRLVGPDGAIAVDQAGAGVGQIAVPHLVGAFRQRKAGDLAATRRIEQAKVDAGGVGGEHREIYAKPVPGRAQRVGCARQQPIRPSRHASASLAGPRASRPASSGPRASRALTKARETRAVRKSVDAHGVSLRRAASPWQAAAA